MLHSRKSHVSQLVLGLDTVSPEWNIQFSVSATISCTTERHLRLTKQIVICLVQGIKLKCVVPETDSVYSPSERLMSTNHLTFKRKAYLPTGRIKDVFKTTFLPWKTQTNSFPPSLTWFGITPAILQLHALLNVSFSDTTPLDSNMGHNASAVMSKIFTWLLRRLPCQTLPRFKITTVLTQRRSFPILNVILSVPAMVHTSVGRAIS